MSVYIATKFENTEGFNALKQLLDDNGIGITHDWTQESLEGLNETERFFCRQRCAEEDLKGVEKAEAVIVLPVAKPMAGAFTELGLAVALKKLVIVVDAFTPDKQLNIFYYLPEVVHVKTIAEAVEEVKDRFPWLVRENSSR